MVPGPAVNGMVSGKKATSSALAAGAACACLRSSWSWGAARSSQARDATTSPPAMRSALSVTPKKPISVAPAQNATSITPAE